MTVSERELVEWMIYWTLEPPLETRVDFGFAHVISWLFNINRNPGLGQARGANDFMPQWGNQTTPESDEDGMTTDRVLPVMNALMRHQEMREQTLRRNGGG